MVILRDIMYLLIGYIGGLFAIRNLPLITGEWGILISEIILYPARFFIGMIYFFVSFIALSSLLRQGLEQVYNFLLKKKKPSKPILILNLGVIGCFYLFVKETMKYTIHSFGVVFILLIFTLFYGMISIDFKRERKRDLEQ